MHIVVVKNAVWQAVEVIQRADRLGQFLVQAIAGLLRAGVVGQERSPRFSRRDLQLRPTGDALTPGAGDIRTGREIFGTTKQAALGR